MSTLLEDRLAAALQARADQVAPEDLRPLEVPVRPGRVSRPVALGLAAAAAALVVVGVPLGAGLDLDGDPAPPARSGGPQPVPGKQLTMDVDGDGGPDKVGLSYDERSGRYTLRVDRFGGETVQASGVAAHLPTLLPGFDLDGDTAAEVAVRVDADPAQLPDLFTYVRGAGLVPVAVPGRASDAAGWSPDSDGSGWASRQGRLYSWAAAPGATPADAVDFWVWQLDRTAATPAGPRRRCLPPGDDFPVSCRTVPRLSAQQGRADVDGDGVADHVEVQYTAAWDDDSVESFEVVVRTPDGTTYSALGPGGWRPALGEPLSLAGDGSQQVLVRQEGGDSDTPLVFAVVAGKLRLAEAVGPAPAPVSSWDAQGRTLRYWIADGHLYSLRTLSSSKASPLPVDVWSWSLGSDGGRAELRPTDLGRQCLDPGAELPRTC